MKGDLLLTPAKVIKLLRGLDPIKLAKTFIATASYDNDLLVANFCRVLSSGSYKCTHCVFNVPKESHLWDSVCVLCEPDKIEEAEFVRLNMEALAIYEIRSDV